MYQDGNSFNRNAYVDEDSLCGPNESYISTRSATSMAPKAAFSLRLLGCDIKIVSALLSVGSHCSKWLCDVSQGRETTAARPPERWAPWVSAPSWISSLQSLGTRCRDGHVERKIQQSGARCPGGASLGEKQITNITQYIKKIIANEADCVKFYYNRALHKSFTEKWTSN